MTALSRRPSTVLRANREHEKYKVCGIHSVEDDESLSFKACGILWYLLSRPDGWTLNRTDLQNRHTDGPDSIITGVKELKVGGYLRIIDLRDTQGRYLSWVWVVSEKPILTEEAWQVILKDLELSNRVINPV